VGEFGNLALCHTFQDGRDDETRNGYRFIRASDKGAGWGVWGWGEKKGKKGYRPSVEPQTVYQYPDRDGNPLIRVTRQKGKQPEFYQSYFVEGAWLTASKVADTVKAEMRGRVPLYRYAEIRAAIERDEAIVFVEGEVCADALWKIGIPATTSIGGSKSYSTWGNYSADLTGARLIVGMPDRDQVGMKYLEAVMKDQPIHHWIKAFPKSPLWGITLPEDGGLDVADWISEGATKGDVMALISAVETSVETTLHLGTTHSNSDGERVSAAVVSVVDLLDRNLEDWREENELSLIAAKSGMDKRAFNSLVMAVKSRRDIGESIKQIDIEAAPTIDVADLLPKGSKLVAKMKNDGRLRGIDPVMLFQYLVGVNSAFLKKDTRLDICGTVMPTIVWSAIIAKSGRGKTRAETLICHYMTERQKTAVRAYHEEKKEFDKFAKQAEKSKVETAEELVPPAVARKYAFNVGTIQGVVKQLKDQIQYGSVWARDELAGLFKSLGQFSKGDHEGGEILLNLWDCSDIIWDRAEAENSFIAENPTMSIIGGIQPGKFRQVFKDPDDVDGLAARILFTMPRVINSKHNAGYCELSDYLPVFFTLIENLNLGTVGISRDAYLLWRDKEYAARQYAHTCGSGALDAWLHKASGHLGRIAINLHVFECVEDPLKNRDILTLETMQRAIVYWEYCRACYERVLSTGADSSSIQSVLTKVLDKAIEMSGLSAREANQYVNAIASAAKESGRTPTAYAYDLFSQLVEAGKGRVEQVGKTRKFIPLICLDPESQKVTTLTTVDESIDVPEELPVVRKCSVVSTPEKEEPKKNPFPEPKEDPSIHYSDENIANLADLVRSAIEDGCPEEIDSLFEPTPIKIRSQIRELVMMQVDPGQSVTVEQEDAIITEHDGFKIGDRVKLSLDRLTPENRKIRIKEGGIEHDGEEGEIVGFVENKRYGLIGIRIHLDNGIEKKFGAIYVHHCTERNASWVPVG